MPVARADKNKEREVKCVKRSKTGINLPGILATLLLLVTTLYTPSISAHAEDNNEVVVTQKVNSAWDGGYVAEIIITNNTADELQNWKLTVNSELVITSIWNATAQQEGDAVIIVPMDYNANVVAGGSVNIGFCGAGEYSEMAITCTYDNGNNAENNNSENNTGDEENSGETNTGDVVPEENNNEENNSEETPAEETPSEEDVPEEVQLNAVLGFVYDEEGNAVAGAQVTIDEHARQLVGDNAQITAVTDENGAYALMLPAGDYRLHIICADYEIEIVSVSVIDGIENVVEDVVLKAIKPSVSIVAKDSETEMPLNGAEVIIRSGWGAHDTEVIAKYETDENGTLKTELPEGKYTFELKKRGYMFAYFNVVSEVNGAPQELTLKSYTHTFEGQVLEKYTNAKGEHYVARDVEVKFYSQATGELVDETVTDDKGNYEVRLNNDMYYAVYQQKNHTTVTVRDINGDVFTGIADTYDNDLETVYMEYMYPMGTVTGRVVDTNGRLIGYSQGRPLLKFNRIGLAGDEPVQAPDFNLYADLNPRYGNGRYGDGTFHYVLPAGKYQIWCGPVDSGCDTAVSAVIEVKEGEDTTVPTIVLDRTQKISGYPINYNAHIQVIDIVTGKPISNAKAYIMFGGSNIYSDVGFIGNDVDFIYTDANGEATFEYRGAAIKLAVFADGYKDRSFNCTATVDGEIIYYCAMIPEDEPDPYWEW